VYADVLSRVQCLQLANGDPDNPDYVNKAWFFMYCYKVSSFSFTPRAHTVPSHFTTASFLCDMVARAQAGSFIHTTEQPSP